MSGENGISRRATLVKLGLLLNGVVGAVLAVPIVRYLLSPVTRERKFGYESWLSLGGLEQPVMLYRTAIIVVRMVKRRPVVGVARKGLADI